MRPLPTERCLHTSLARVNLDETQHPASSGTGVLGLVGVAAAIASAVYHAPGKRVRDFPITLDRLP
jgi:xanthine dehydrogenase YagR molybdenum-binding subunit